MDITELNSKLDCFMENCIKIQFPIMSVRYVEAFPGISNTTYDLEVVADWRSKYSYIEALEILTDVLWDTYTKEERSFLFNINIKESHDDYMLLDEVLIEGGEATNAFAA